MVQFLYVIGCFLIVSVINAPWLWFGAFVASFFVSGTSSLIIYLISFIAGLMVAKIKTQ